MKKLAIIIVVLQLFFCSEAQPISIRKYNIENGLVNNDVLNIYQDSRGFIWLCTRGGLSRYDGSRFYNYTTANGLTNDMINDIVEIKPQEFIVAQNANGPLLLKDGTAKSFLSNQGLTLNNFQKLNNKKLIATTDFNGIVSWQDNQFKKIDATNKEIMNYAGIINDSVWLISQEHSFIQLITSSLKPLSSRLPLNATTIFTDNDHRTWVGTTHGLLLINNETAKDKKITFSLLPSSFNIPVLKETYITKMMIDSEGNYWICTSEGLVNINRSGASKMFTEKDGLPSTSVNCIMEDKENNIWVGTTHGLAKFSLQNAVRTFAINLGLTNDGTTYILPVSKDGALLFDGKKIYQVDMPSGKLTHTLSFDSSGYGIYELNRKELIITHKTTAGIYTVGNDKELKVEHFPDIRFSAITKYNDQSFLSSYSNKISYISNGLSSEKLSIEANDLINNLLIDKDNFLWAATQNSGLFKIRIEKINDSLQLKIVDTIAARLPDKHIRTLYADKANELWVGTRYKGVIRLLKLPNGKYAIENYGTTRGLSSDFVRSINRDSMGNIWVGTMQGIDKLIPTTGGYKIFSFGKLNRFFSHVYYTFFYNNNLFTSDYPYVISMHDMQQDTLQAPPVYIMGAYRGMHDTIINHDQQQVKLPYNKAQIYFEFSAPQYVNEDFTTYSYRLLSGSDTNWSISSKLHSVYFANLRPGNYTFQVRALGFNNKWGQPSVYSFMVSTPFWQQIWFILLIILIVAAGVYGLYRYRVQQLIRLQKVRNNIARDLHDEIGSSLTNINILSSLSKKNLLQPQHAQNFLQRISEEVSSSSQALDDIIWSVNSNNDTLEVTVARMRRYAAELFDANNIGYELYLDTAFEEKKLLMEQRRDIYLLYKEALNNISKHAGAKHVSIQISIVHNHFYLNIEDDGKGFNMNDESNRHGLKGMKERVQKWKGKIAIESAEQKGTSVQISMPVSK